MPCNGVLCLLPDADAAVRPAQGISSAREPRGSPSKGVSSAREPRGSPSKGVSAAHDPPGSPSKGVSSARRPPRKGPQAYTHNNMSND